MQFSYYSYAETQYDTDGVMFPFDIVKTLNWDITDAAKSLRQLLWDTLRGHRKLQT